MKLLKLVRFLSLFIVCSAVLVSVLSAQSARTGINKVVIDAGHGGKDAGAVGGGYKEKDINLAVALRLGELIGEHYPDVGVIYTRKTDVFVPLAERADKANKSGADLFISIHVNASKNTSASGTETFVMGVDKSQQNLDITMRENDVIVYEEDYETRYQGYTPGSPESYIIFSLMQYSYQGQSLNLASLVQQQYTKSTSIGNRGVKQAGFLVLWYAAMPSILTELGFISNANDRKFLVSKNGQEKMARCLFNAFSEYKVKSDGKGQLIALDSNAAGEPAGNISQTADKDTQRTTVESPRSADSLSPKTTDEKICYRVQVLSSPQKVARNSSRFGTYRGYVTEINTDGAYKYYVGEVASYREALSLQTEVRKQIKDAFVVAFAGESPIPVQEARRRE